MEYHRRDILYIRELLGYKRIDNTVIYIQLDDALFFKLSEEF